MKKQKYALEVSIAEHMLANVFSTCHKASHTVPLETLMAYSNYRRERYLTQRAVIGLMMALFLLLPVLFITARLSVSTVNVEAGGNPEYGVSIEASVPVLKITAEVDGKKVVATRTDDDEFVLMPSTNGEMTVTVTLVNRQETTMVVNVTEVDMVNPVLVSTAYDSNNVYLFVEDAQSGINWNGITVNGESEGYTYNQYTGCVIIPYPDGFTNVRVPDNNGNILDINLKIGE